MVLSGVTTLEQMQENAAMMQDLRPLDENAHAALDSLLESPVVRIHYDYLLDICAELALDLLGKGLGRGSLRIIQYQHLRCLVFRPAGCKGRHCRHQRQGVLHHFHKASDYAGM